MDYYDLCLFEQAKKLEEHRRKYDRLRQEQLVKERQERVRRAQEEHEKAARQQKESANAFDFGPDGSDPFAAFGGMGGMGGGMPGMGGMGGMGGGSRAGGMGGMGGGPGGMDFGSLLSDPEVLAAFQVFEFVHFCLLITMLFLSSPFWSKEAYRTLVMMLFCTTS